MNYYISESDRRKFNSSTDSAPSLIHRLNFKLFSKYLLKKKILDIGCWTGQFEQVANKYVGHITAIDPNRDAIHYARKHCKNVTFNVGYAEKMHFPKDSYDVAILFDVIEHIPKGTEKQVISNIYNILKCNGIIIISTPHRNILSYLLDPAFFLYAHRHYGINEITKLLEQSGFIIESKHIRGGFVFGFMSLIDIFYKHILHKPKLQSRFIDQLITYEYTHTGFYSLHVVAIKKKICT
jgi:SAM-dependent methyltransferase